MLVKLGQVVRCLVALSTLMLAPALAVQVRPRGIYAVVKVEDEINALMPSPCSENPVNVAFPHVLGGVITGV